MGAQIRLRIEVISSWRGRRLVPLSAVRGVQAGFVGWTAHTREHGKIRFNNIQRGWRQFREALNDHLHRGGS